MKRHIPTIVALMWALGIMATAGYAQQSYELGNEGFTEVAKPDPATPAGQLAIARKALADGDPEKAIDLTTDWIDSHHNHKLLPDAYLIRADAKVADGNEFKALYDYEYIVRMYPGSPQFHTAMEREYDIAQMYAGGRKRKLWGMRIIPAGGEAEELLIRIQERDPGSKLAEQAGKALGDYYYQRGEMYMAAEAYSIFVENYPQSQWAAYAMQHQVDANLATFKGPAFDATGLYEARSRLVIFEKRFPGPAQQHGAEELLNRVDESMAQKSLLVARWYHGQGNDVSATFMFERVVNDHPASAAAQDALAELRKINPDAAAQYTDEKLTELVKLNAQREPTAVKSPNAPAIESKEPVETNAPIVPTPKITNPE